MISANFIGGLGNQMFIIAASTSLAIDNADTSIFDTKLYYAGPQRPPISYMHTIYSKISFGNINPNSFFHYSEPLFTYQKIPYSSNTMIFGYFQSEKYFKGNKDFIIDMFLREDIVQKLYIKYNNLLVNSVSLHIRRGDYLYLQMNHPCPSIDYYLEGLKYIETIKQIENILIFSDDIEWCRENFKDPRIAFIVNHQDYEDMYLMSLCENNIIANSSFSWWGSYLNKNKSKIVICPQRWFGPQAPYSAEDIYYENNIIL